MQSGPIIGMALVLIFWLYRDLDFGRFLTGLRDAHVGWIAMLAFTILLEQVGNGWKWRQILYDVKPVKTLRLTGSDFALLRSFVRVCFNGGRSH